MFGISSTTRDSDAGRSSAEGGNGNVRRTFGAAHRHEAITTPNLAAVRDLHSGAPHGYVGKRRAK